MDSFHQFLKQPAFDVCRGVLLRDGLLLLLYAAWGIVCLTAGYQGQGLVYIWEPFVVMPLLISLRRERLPRPIVEAYDAFMSDIREGVSSDGLRTLVGQVLDHITFVTELVTTWIENVFWFLICFISSLLTAQESSVRARVRFAWESTSIQRSLFRAHRHGLRAPPALA